VYVQLRPRGHRQPPGRVSGHVLPWPRC